MSFGYAYVLPGYAYVAEPDNPTPATFDSAANPAIFNGEWVSFTRTAANEAFNIVPAPHSHNLFASIAPTYGMTTAAKRLATWHALSIAHSGELPLDADSPEVETGKAKLKRMKNLLQAYDRRIGVADVRAVVLAL